MDLFKIIIIIYIINIYNMNYIDLLKEKFDDVYNITLNYLEQLSIIPTEEKIEEEDKIISNIKKEYVKIFDEEIEENFDFEEESEEILEDDEIEEILEEILEDVIKDLKKMKISKDTKKKKRKRRKRRKSKILDEEKIDKDMWYNQSFVSNKKEVFNFYK
jgi:hypothetical protein